MRWKWWKVHRDEIMMKTRWIQFSFIWGLEPVPALQRHLANTSPAGRRRETSLRHRWDIAETSLSRRPSSKRSPRTAWLFVFLAPFHRLGRYFLWFSHLFFVFDNFDIHVIHVIDFFRFLLISLYFPFESSIEVTSNSFNFFVSLWCKDMSRTP